MQTIDIRTQEHTDAFETRTTHLKSIGKPQQLLVGLPVSQADSIVAILRLMAKFLDCTGCANFRT